MDVLGYATTYPTKCRECGAGVFFHSNGHGDAVFLDALGPPWPVHPCYYAFRNGRQALNFAAYRARMVKLYGRVESGAGTPRRRGGGIGWTPTSPRSRKDPRGAQPRRPRPEDIVRYAPEHNEVKRLTVSGVLRELLPWRNLKDIMPAGTVGYELLWKALRSASYTQVTIIDRDLLSYTAWLPQPEPDIKLGDLVRASLERVDVGTKAYYVCRGMERVAF